MQLQFCLRAGKFATIFDVTNAKESRETQLSVWSVN
jgi:hypothetical protein